MKLKMKLIQYKLIFIIGLLMFSVISCTDNLDAPFENETFTFPSNIGIDKEGLNFFYNPYEVASYADGPTKVVIRKEEWIKFK